jgi:hypothetical protein
MEKFACNVFKLGWVTNKPISVIKSLLADFGYSQAFYEQYPVLYYT